MPGIRQLYAGLNCWKVDRPTSKPVRSSKILESAEFLDQPSARPDRSRVLSTAFRIRTILELADFLDQPFRVWTTPEPADLLDEPPVSGRPSFWSRDNSMCLSP